MVRERVIHALKGMPHTDQIKIPRMVSVLGLGKTGFSVAAFLARRGARVVASDPGPPSPRDQTLTSLGVHVVRGRNWVERGDFVVISPGIKPSSETFQLAHERGGEVVSAPELFARVSAIPVIAISGTDGKSTVTTWIEALLRHFGVNARAGGNLGIPMVEFLEGQESPDVAIIEISAFQLISCRKFCPAISVMTNVVDDHLDYFDGDPLAYRTAKQALLNLSGPGSSYIYPADDPVASAWPLPDLVNPIPVCITRESSGDSGILVSGGGVHVEGKCVFRAEDLHVKGSHNLLNGAMVWAVGRLLGLTDSELLEGLKSFRGLPHRCEWLGKAGNVNFVNDSKATSPHAVMAGVKSLSGPIHLLIGGSDKGVKFDELIGFLRERKVSVYPYGETGPVFAHLLSTPDLYYTDLAEAFEAAMSASNEPCTVLLSPGCASFDQYQSFVDRGEHFRDLVEERLRFHH